MHRRFTTYEHIEDIPIMIVKKDGRREVFDGKRFDRACSGPAKNEISA